MKTTHIILFVLFTFKIFAQPRPQWSDESLIKRATYIFEGEIIDTLYYNRETGRTDDLSIEIINGKFSHSVIPLPN